MYNQKISSNDRKARRRKQTFPMSMLFVPVIALTMRLASSQTAEFSLFVLAAYAITGRVQAIQALSLAWLITMFNPGLAPEASLTSIGHHAVIIGAMLSVLLRTNMTGGKINIKPHVLATLFLGVFLIIHSLFFSRLPDVSLLKSFSFIVVFATLISAWSALAPHQRIQAEIFVFGGMIAVVLASLPFIATPVGYLRNGTGFQGILSHPQAFGPFVALLGVWLGGRFLSEQKLPLWQLALFVLCPVLILASEARIAGGAFALGIGLPLIFMLVFKPYNLKSSLSGLFTGKFAIAIWIAGIGLLAFSVVIFAQLDHYISKSGRSGTTGVITAYEKSRGALMERMVVNIKENAIGGIGFGIASFPESMKVQREPFFGIPVGAPIEKGVMPLAVMEELGIPGFLLVFGWLWMLIRRSYRAGFTSLVVFVTALMVNLGENIFFSAGGAGLIFMVLSTWAVTLRTHDQRVNVPLWIK